MQTASPGLPLVSRVRRHIKVSVYARDLEGLRVCLGITAEARAITAQLSAAIAHEQHLYLLLKGGHIGDIRRSDTTTAENSDVGEFIEICESDLPGLHPTHGEAGHGSIGLIGERTEVGVNEGDQIIDENMLESAEVEATAPSGTASCSTARHIAVGHHNDEGLGFSLRD